MAYIIVWVIEKMIVGHQALDLGPLVLASVSSDMMLAANKDSDADNYYCPDHLEKIVLSSR